MGCGSGRRRGGRGRRHRFRATGLTRWQRATDTPLSVDQQREALKAQAADLEQALADVRTRLNGLDADES